MKKSISILIVRFEMNFAHRVLDNMIKAHTGCCFILNTVIYRMGLYKMIMANEFTTKHGKYHKQSAKLVTKTLIRLLNLQLSNLHSQGNCSIVMANATFGKHSGVQTPVQYSPSFDVEFGNPWQP